MKRFRDTGIWEKEWFLGLSQPEKLAWDYIVDHCDNVGVWKPNTVLAELFIGSSIRWEDFPGKCNGNVKVLENGKWWLIDFCSFQYGTLSESSHSKPILSYIRQLKEQGLWRAHLACTERAPLGMGTVQEKERTGKGLDKVKEKDKSEEVTEILNGLKEKIRKDRVSRAK